MSGLAELVGRRVLLLDAAMGSQVQAMALDVERDFDGCENCTEVLNRTRPDIVREIHRASLAAGSDAIETNSFGGSPITLGEFGLADEARALNIAAARIAREAADEFSADGRPRFVFGAIGPGTRLPTLEQVSWADVADAVAVQAAGLIAGGADALLIETVQDLLQAKAAVAGARRALAEAKRDMPIVAQVTVESTGTLLAGADIAAAATVLHALDVEIAGLNCATGPQEMAEHLSWLSQNWPGPISVLPNAGLPELVGGETRYPLSADELAEWLARFVEEDGVALVGGCCGTTAEHVAALDAMLRARAEDGFRPRVRRRRARWTPSVASLYGQTPLRQETALLAIGERCNANGSRKFRALQKDRAWDACVAVGREQAAEGSHCIDLCTALVGEDETEAMCALVGRMGRAVAAPLVIDSTELGVIEAALARYGGKAIINSINFEDGEAPAAARLALARRFGAAAVALTIDEEGMAKTAAEKLRIARRLAEFAAAHGLPAADLLIDPLTFTICTGNEEDRGLAAETLDAIAAIAEALPECQIVLGLSNVSFGLKPAARHVLNSVFLDHARRRGMTAALLHPGKIAPLHQVPEAEAQAAEDLIFDRRRPGYDPLHAFIALFEGRDGAAPAKRERPAKVEERLSRRIVDGDRDGLESDLEEAMRDWRPLDIVNRFLLDGMKTVGELFGSGAMQLPFVLQSAETMKAAVRWLEPHMDRVDGGARGTIVLATVKGDVHDIGKNLTDIILTNNGFRVVNLGIKQPIARILEAADEHGADCIGMSGLLVKSTAIMRENLLEMSRRGLDFPVLLGGAALTRRYVEEDCAAAYEAGRVAYARDAFDGLSLMDAVSKGRFDAEVAESRARRRRTDGGAQRTESAPAAPERRAAPTRPRRGHRVEDAPTPVPAAWGARRIDRLPLVGLRPYLNTHTLYQLHWGYKKQGRSFREFREWSRKTLDPMLEALIERCAGEEILTPSAAWGLWPAVGDGDDLVLLAPDDRSREAARFTLPRQKGREGLCIADFVRDAEAGEPDVVGLQAVTVGARASAVEREYFAADRYRDYLYLHGLGVEMAEAMAEYTHKRIREELGFGHEDARDMDKLIRHGYRGARYSFGFPACPRLEDQERLLDLLGAEAIGVRLGEEAQLEPEQSTSALVIHHPRARYFTV